MCLMNKLFKYICFLFFALILPFNVFAKNNEVTLYLFHGDGCPHCQDEMEYLKTIEKKYDYLKIEKYEVWYDEENSELLKKVQDVYEISSKGVPTNIIGNTVITGFSLSTGSKLERAIEYYHDNDYENIMPKIIDGSYDGGKPVDTFDDKEKKLDDDLTVDVPIFNKVNLKNVSLISAAFIIGLIDGFNPCAMWVLLFLISVLMGIKNRKRMWILGLTFLITSALVYMFIMLSWINIAVKMTSIIWLRNIIAIIALIGGIVNLKSFIKERKESGCQVVDDKKRKKIFSKIKKFTSEKNFIIALFGVVGLAISVNVVELACSAGLPIVFSELLVLNKTSETMKFVYTLIYIFFFLIDDLVVFFIAMITMKITGISTKYNKFSHLLGGFIMIIIGVLLLFKPGWLMFNFK